MAKRNSGVKQPCSQRNTLGADVDDSVDYYVDVIIAKVGFTILCCDIARHGRLHVRLCIRLRRHGWCISSSRNVREGLRHGIPAVPHCVDRRHCHVRLHDQDDNWDCLITRYGRGQSAGLVRVAAPLLRVLALSSGSE